MKYLVLGFLVVAMSGSLALPSSAAREALGADVSEVCVHRIAKHTPVSQMVIELNSLLKDFELNPTQVLHFIGDPRRFTLGHSNLPVAHVVTTRILGETHVAYRSGDDPNLIHVGYYNPELKLFGKFSVDARGIQRVGQLVSGAQLLELKHRLELQGALFGLRPAATDLDGMREALLRP